MNERIMITAHFDLTPFDLQQASDRGITSRKTAKVFPNSSTIQPH